MKELGLYRSKGIMEIEEPFLKIVGLLLPKIVG